MLAGVLVLWAVGFFSAIVLLGDWWDPRTPDGRCDRRLFFAAAGIVGLLAALLLAAQFAAVDVLPAVVSGLLAAGVGYVALAVTVGRLVRRRAEIREMQEPVGSSTAWLRDLTRHRGGNVALLVRDRARALGGGVRGDSGRHPAVAAGHRARSPFHGRGRFSIARRPDEGSGASVSLN